MIYDKIIFYSEMCSFSYTLVKCGIFGMQTKKAQQITIGIDMPMALTIIRIIKFSSILTRKGSVNMIHVYQQSIHVKIIHVYQHMWFTLSLHLFNYLFNVTQLGLNNVLHHIRN